MKFTLLTALSASLALAQGQAPIYGKCDKDNFAQKANVNKDYPIVPALSDGRVVISGNFYIIDGCNFGLRNYTGYNFQLTTINGGFPGSSDSMTLTNTPLSPSANPTTLTFELKNDAGAQANFNGFSEVRFYEQSLKTVIATVSLPAITGGGAAAGGSGSSATAANSAGTSLVVDFLGSVSAIVASFLVL